LAVPEPPERRGPRHNFVPQLLPDRLFDRQISWLGTLASRHPKQNLAGALERIDEQFFGGSIYTFRES